MSEPTIQMRPLYWAGYVLAGALVVNPALNLLLSVWPLQPSNLHWRFGALGLFSGSLMIALLGAVLLAFSAAQLGHRMFLRVGAAATGLMSAGLMAVIGLFVLDALQIRNTLVQPQLKEQFDMNSAKTLAGFASAWVVCAVLAWGGWRATALPRGARTRERSGEDVVLVGARSLARNA